VLPRDVTELLSDWSKGDRSALDRLVPLVYPDLQNLARAYLHRGASPLTLQTTAVVNELFLKLLAKPPRTLDSRRHFFVLAARMMRTALVDHYRHARAEKRGGHVRRVPLHDELTWIDANGPELLELDRALAELEELDREQADLFCMRFMLGCTADETAALSGLSRATVDRRVRLARAWLFRRLRGEAPPDEISNV
jgi:RNA polymerase sigma factor (TIGR02999 family)